MARGAGNRSLTHKSSVAPTFDLGGVTRFTRQNTRQTPFAAYLYESCAIGAKKRPDRHHSLIGFVTLRYFVLKMTNMRYFERLNR